MMKVVPFVAMGVAILFVVIMGIQAKKSEVPAEAPATVEVPAAPAPATTP